MQIDQAAIEKIADSILKVIEKKLSENNTKVVGNALKNHKVDGDHIVRESIGNVHIKDAAIDTAKIKDLTVEIARIAVAEIGTAIIDVAQIDQLSATVANIVNATIQSADIEWADIANLTATIATIAVANIETARIDFAQIDGLVAGVALIQEAVGGKVQIADLSVSDANIVTLNANKIEAGTLSVERLVIVGSTQSIVYAVNEANGTAQLSQTTIDGGSITEKTITADQIIAHGITADCLNVAEIFANEALIGAITTDNIAAGTITAASAIIADGAITTAKIGNAQITSAKIADANITTAKIGDAQITGAKIADATITGAKIANATITNANIAEATINSANIGDGQITTAKIGDAQITNAKINDLNASKINAGTLSADRIAAGSITTDKLGASAITADKIAAGAITTEKIAAGAIQTNMISDLTGGAVVELDPETGMTLKQPSIGTEMRARADGLGFYENNVMFAGVGVVDGKGRFYANSMSDPQSGNQYRWQFDEETQDLGGEVALYNYGVQFYNGSAKLGKIMSTLAWKNLVEGTEHAGPGDHGSMSIDGDGTDVVISNLKKYEETESEHTESRCESRMRLNGDKMFGVELSFVHYASDAADDVDASGGVQIGAESSDIWHWDGRDPMPSSLAFKYDPDIPDQDFTDFKTNLEFTGYAFVPYASNCAFLGRTTQRWRGIYSNQSLNTSDRRVKCDITDIDTADAIAFIMALRPRKYRMIDDGDSGKINEGFVAQEVAEILPDTGREQFGGYHDADPNMLYLDYVQFIAPLTATVQAQHKRIEALTKRIEEQDKRIAALEAAMERLMGSKKEG